MEISFFERLGLKLVEGHIRAKIGDKMSQIAALAGLLMGSASMLTCAGCILQHFIAGDLMAGHSLEQCLALGTAGVAMFSPGVQALKVGFFSRTASPPTSPPGGAPTIADVAAAKTAETQQPPAA